ncbi:hypothetical protein LguiA_013761 [Lonicera macranthoides]
MAAPVGNLIRRLEEFEKQSKPDPIISIHLSEIRKAFDRLQPFLVDAELKREKDDEISRWVSMVSGLAREVEEIIVSYNFHLVSSINADNGSLYDKVVYFNKQVLLKSSESVYAKTQRFLSKHALPVNLPHRIHSSNQQDRACTTGPTGSTNGWQRRIFGKDLVELMGRFSEVVIKEMKKLNFEAWSMQLVRNTLARVADSIVSNNVPKPDSSKAIQTILESINMVGRKTEVSQLEALLRTPKEQDSSCPVEVIGVIGEPGVGKSTLAAVVYERVKRHFDCSAWVTVPLNPNAKKLVLDVLRGILKSLSVMAPDNMDEASESQLKEMINRRLSQKKFLLVLDDIATMESLRHIKNVLPKNCKAKIICTARIESPDYDRFLPLESLSAQNALILLQKRSCLERVGSTFWSSVQSETMAISSICARLPLAIATVAGMLSTKQMEAKEWSKVHQMLEKANFIASSYADLRPVLKSCFLYTASYNSDFEVSCKKLRRLWIAEGFVQVLDHNMTLQEAAKLQLDELIQRNMIQVAQVGVDGKVETCRLLIPMREFALKRCQQDQFCTILKSGAYKILPEKPHRLFFQVESTGRADEFDSLNMCHLYSFLAYKSNQHRSLFATSINSKLLSVLELQQLPNDILPEAIGDLCLLRYLGLRGTKLKTVPSSLNKLQSLLTLDIRNTFVTSLPTSLEGLRRLKHLLLAGSFNDKVVYLPIKIEALNNLQTVSGLKLTEGIANGLHQLPQLQKLSVGEVENVHSQILFQSIEKMKFLRSFTMKCALKGMIEIPFGVQSDPVEPFKKIRLSNSFTMKHAPNGTTDIPLGACGNLEKLRMGGRIENLLAWVSKLNALKYLYLWDSFLIEDPFSTLQNLPNLVLLSLCNAYEGEEIQFASRGFPKLKKLSILHCSNLIQWNEIRGGAMGKLQMLTIGYCPKLYTLPRGLEKLTSLQVLQMSNMPAQFVKDATNIHSISGSNFSLQVRETARPSVTVHNSLAALRNPMLKPMPMLVDKSVKIEPAYKYMPPRPNLQRRKNSFTKPSLTRISRPNHPYPN